MQSNDILTFFQQSLNIQERWLISHVFQAKYGPLRLNWTHLDVRPPLWDSKIASFEQSLLTSQTHTVRHSPQCRPNTPIFQPIPTAPTWWIEALGTIHTFYAMLSSYLQSGMLSTDTHKSLRLWVVFNTKTDTAPVPTIFKCWTQTLKQWRCCIRTFVWTSPKIMPCDELRIIAYDRNTCQQSWHTSHSLYIRFLFLQFYTRRPTATIHKIGHIFLDSTIQHHETSTLQTLLLKHTSSCSPCVNTERLFAPTIVVILFHLSTLYILAFNTLHGLAVMVFFFWKILKNKG